MKNVFKKIKDSDNYCDDCQTSDVATIEYEAMARGKIRLCVFCYSSTGMLHDPIDKQTMVQLLHTLLKQIK